MTARSGLRHVFRRNKTEETMVEPTVAETGSPTEKGMNTGDDAIQFDNGTPTGEDPEKDVVPTADAQRGVQDVEAMALTWTKPYLIALFINMFLLYLTNGFQSSILTNLTPFATSAFESHSLLVVINIVASAMTAAVYIPLAKMLDLWGRAEGFLLMVVFATIGMIIMASSNGIVTFCVAQVFYSIGFGGLIFSIDVFTADVSKLRNRGLAYAFTSSPYIITAFAGPKASDDFYYNSSWRWGFGTFAIVLPIVAAPMYIILKLNLRKAENRGLLARERSGRTLLQNIVYYFHEFDVAGVVLFSCGLTVFLLPFTLADSAPNGWKSGYIIAMIIVGFFVLAAFVVYEIYLARSPFLDVQLLVNRTVIGACLLDVTYQISYYCWNSYFTSYLQVVNNLSVAEAGYVASTFDIVSGVLLIGVGFAIRTTNRFKWLLYGAIPLYIFSQGLMIYFRRPNQSVWYMVMCQIFISIGGSIFIICQQVAILASSDHQHIAAVMALLYVAGNIGGAIGNTICGAIWTNTFPQALERYLPADAMANFDDIYGKLDVQLEYPVGSATRLAIQEAYGFAQKRMLIAGTAIMALSLIWLLLIKNINLAKIPQVKGMVF